MSDIGVNIVDVCRMPSFVRQARLYYASKENKIKKSGQLIQTRKYMLYMFYMFNTCFVSLYMRETKNSGLIYKHKQLHLFIYLKY